MCLGGRGRAWSWVGAWHDGATHTPARHTVSGLGPWGGGGGVFVSGGSVAPAVPGLQQLQRDGPTHLPVRHTVSGLGSWGSECVGERPSGLGGFFRWWWGGGGGKAWRGVWGGGWGRLA
jgi:hypothetical protein